MWIGWVGSPVCAWELSRRSEPCPSKFIPQAVPDCCYFLFTAYKCVCPSVGCVCPSLEQQSVTNVQVLDSCVYMLCYLPFLCFPCLQQQFLAFVSCSLGRLDSKSKDPTSDNPNRTKLRMREQRGTKNRRTQVYKSIHHCIHKLQSQKNVNMYMCMYNIMFLRRC